MSSPSVRSSRIRALAAFLAVAVPSAAIGAMGDGFVDEVRSFFADSAADEPSRLVRTTPRHDAAKAVEFPREAAAVRRSLDSDPPPGAAAELIDRLGIVGDRTDIERLLPLSEHPNTSISMAAMNALGRIGGSRSIDRLVTIARSEDATVNGLAVHALGLSSDSEAIDVLEDLTHHTDQWRRQQALDSLALRGGARARRAVHRAFLRSTSADAWSVANAVASLGGEVDRRLLMRAATSPHDPRGDAAIWALATIPGPDTDALLIEMAESAVGSRRSTAIGALGNVRDPRAVEVLLDLWDRAPNNRYEIINALGQNKADGALDALLTLLGEARPDQATWFTEALAQRGEPTAREVLRVLAKEDGMLGEAALATLGRLADDSVTGMLLARFDEQGRLPPADTLQYLAMHGGDEGWQLIEEVLAEGTMSDRSNVIWALQARGDADAAARLLDLVDTGDAWAASSAMSALESMGGDAREGLRDKLMTRLENDEGGDFAAISSTLARLGGDGVLDALKIRLDDGTDTERWSAMSALGQMEDPAARAALEAMLDSEDATVRSTVLSTLMWSGTQEVSPEVLDKALLDEDTSVRMTAIQALGGRGDEDSVERLLELFDDEDPSIRSTVLSSLSTSGDPRASELMIGALDDPDLAQSAMWGLQSMGTPEGTAAIRAMAADSEDLDQRLSAIGMLGNDPSSEAGAVLADRLQSDEPGEASAALYALQSRGSTSAAESIAGLLDEIDPDDDPEGLLWQAASALQGIGGRVARERAAELEEILGTSDMGLIDVHGWDCGNEGFGPIIY